MEIFVKVLTARRRSGVTVTNRVIRLVEHAADDVFGRYILVDGRGHDDLRQGNNRLYITSDSDYTVVDNSNEDVPVWKPVPAVDSYIRVHSAKTPKGVTVTDRVFRLLGSPKRDADGLYIIVDGKGHDGLRQGNAKLYISSVSSYAPVDKSEADAQVQTAVEQINTEELTDSQMSEEIKDTFSILEEMTKAVACNVVKGLVVSGPAGIGKSHTVETTLVENLKMLQSLRNGEAQYESISGGMSAAVLYQKLWEYKEEGQVLVFDDCDSILYDEDSLNVLKAALDSKKTRRICWNTRSLHLEKKEIPNSFEYKGGIVFITNVDFKNVKSPRIANHLEAIVSRCHYMDIGIHTPREKIIHMRNVLEGSNMLKNYEFKNGEEQDVVRYIETNVNNLREISLRTVLKVADLRKAVPDRWEKFADRNVLKS